MAASFVPTTSAIVVVMFSMTSPMSNVAQYGLSHFQRVRDEYIMSFCRAMPGPVSVSDEMVAAY